MLTRAANIRPSNRSNLQSSDETFDEEADPWGGLKDANTAFRGF